ncbi:hypothetical protein C1H76_3982 [Elsinoe australis]|uniref:Uncharacterized protein n=1 Tax=Elsinoe australis TaxID=40998 RepID=A0A4U7AYP8_9PEZI|nr:hypothetical protein C1H76_3982 [Elsinoe australis]
MPHGAGSKKRKWEAQAQHIQQTKQSQPNGADTSKPTAVFKPTKGRTHTLSIALPGSIIANCQTHDLKTSLCGAIARALAVFSVDEIVIFNDGAGAPTTASPHAASDAASGYTGFSVPSSFLHHVLSYLETPPYLRKTLFPMHPNLRTAGALPSIDIPSHLKAHEYCPYREGVTTGSAGMGQGTLVDCGLQARVVIEDEVEAGTRVTVRLPKWMEFRAPGRSEEVRAEAVGPETPREEGGYYWGYAVRMAESLSEVFTGAEVEGGYDISVGTSERGVDLRGLLGRNRGTEEGSLPTGWKHLIVVFGGVAGLEQALAADEELKGTGITDVKDVFDYWVNLVPGQGSRTIRTEEAVWLGLMGLRGVVVDRERED